MCFVSFTFITLSVSFLSFYSPLAIHPFLSLHFISSMSLYLCYVRVCVYLHSQSPLSFSSPTITTPPPLTSSCVYVCVCTHNPYSFSSNNGFQIDPMERFYPTHSPLLLIFSRALPLSRKMWRKPLISFFFNFFVHPYH